MTRRVLCSGLIVGLLTTPAIAAGDYDKSETTKAYTLELRVPDAALSIAPLKSEILARWKVTSQQLKSEAMEDMQDNPQFHAYALDTVWRITFEDARVISLSAESFVDENGAHPNGAFDSIVWDKQANRAVPLADIFAKDRSSAAFKAIAASAKTSFLKWLSNEEGSPADPAEADEGIAADPNKLGHYALTYAKGESRANGIVLLYGAGEVWPHVIGDVRLSIPASVFRKFLAPEWKGEFN